MTGTELIKEDLKNYLGKEFEANEIHDDIWVREKGSAVGYRWDKKTNTIMKHCEGDKPIFDNCYSLNDMFKFIVKDNRPN